MARRRGWWRTIPVELAVPLVITGLSHAIAPLAFAMPGALIFPLSFARKILVLCGLRELRRRSSGPTGSLLAVAAGGQVVVVTHAALLTVVLPFVGWRASGFEWFAINDVLQIVIGVVVTCCLVTAARAWRTLVGPVALLLPLASPPYGFVRSLLDPGWGEVAVNAVFSGVIVASTLAMLAVLARIGAGLEAPSDPARGARAARRLVLGWRIRAAGMLLLGALGLALDSTPILVLVALAGLFGSTVVVTSGLLGLARARISGLHAGVCCAAALGTVWAANMAPDWLVLGVRYVSFGSRDNVNLALVLSFALALELMAFGAWPARRYLRSRLDRARGASATRKLCAVVLGTAVVLGLVLLAAWRTDEATAPLVRLALTLVEVGVALAAASLFATLRERLELAAQVDVF